MPVRLFALCGNVLGYCFRPLRRVRRVLKLLVFIIFIITVSRIRLSFLSQNENYVLHVDVAKKEAEVIPKSQSKVSQPLKVNVTDNVDTETQLALEMSYANSVKLAPEVFQSQDDVPAHGDVVYRNLTFYTPLKTSSNEDNLTTIKQFNAIQSWARLVPWENIIVLADDRESCDLLNSRDLHPRCIVHDCMNLEHQRPMLDCLMKLAVTHSKTDQMCFINADIILLRSFVETVRSLFTPVESKRRTLVSGDPVVVGQRIDVPWTMRLDYDSKHPMEKIQTAAKAIGHIHSDYGIDYFVHRRSLLQKIDMPPFLIGLWRWDNYLLSECLFHDDLYVVDATLSALVLHQGVNPPSYDHRQRKGNEYNEKLVHLKSGKRFLLGKTSNAPWLLIGSCTRQCQLIPNPNPRPDFLISRRASSEGYLAVLTVNKGYMELALNWLCWAQRIDFNNYIILAEDQWSYRALLARGIAVTADRFAPEVKEAGDYGSIAFQETMTYRTKFLRRVQLLGYAFLTGDLDTVWYEDALKYLNPACDLRGQTHKNTSISGGFVAVQASASGRQFWEQVVNCQEKNMETIRNMRPGSYEPSKYTEQECINDIAKTMRKKSKFNVCLLDTDLFPDGRAFFEQQLPQQHGRWPIVIHNNWIVGTNRKIERFQKWGLWAMSAEGVCIDEMPYLARDEPMPSPAPVGSAMQALETWLSTKGHDLYRENMVKSTLVNGSIPLLTRHGHAPDDPVGYYGIHSNFADNSFNQRTLSTTDAALEAAMEEISTENEADIGDLPTVIDVGNKPLRWKLLIRILTMNRFHTLRDLLDSLLGADFGGDSVELEISIDAPPEGADVTLQHGHEKVIDVVRQFKWPHGRLRIKQHSVNQGLVNQWINGWRADDNSEVCLFLEDDIQVSPFFYLWLKQALDHYFVSEPHYMEQDGTAHDRVLKDDPRLFGISLQVQHAIVGESTKFRYGSQSIMQLVGNHTRTFLFQQVGSWGAVMFPRPWRAFRSWYAERQKDPHFYPCVPSFITNKWWIRRGQRGVWTAWHIRFAFERGLYSLYFHFPDYPLQGLVKNVRVIGLNYKKNQGDSNALLMIPPPMPFELDNSTGLKTIPVLNQLLPLDEIPLFDFHFRRLTVHRRILSYRRHLFSQLPSNMTCLWMGGDYQAPSSIRRIE